MNKIELFSNSYSDSHTIEITIDPTTVSASGSIFAPIFSIPLEFRLYRLRKGNQPEIDYTLLQIEGYLNLANYERLAQLPSEFILERTNSYNRASSLNLSVLLDLKRIELMERFRLGKDMSLMLEITGVIMLDKEKVEIEKLRARYRGLELKIPQSTWINNVLNKWKFSDVHLVEIEKGKIDAETIPSKTFEYILAAEKHFLSSNWRETLASLYSAFEALAKHHDMKDPDKNFFSKLLTTLPNNMRDRYRDLFYSYCSLLQLGRHEQKPQEAQEEIRVDQNDAKLALIFGQTILSYISKVC